VVVHSLQELLATVVDEANASEINQKRRTVERNLLPALIELVYTSARELSFDDESRRRRFVLTSNSYNFISHTRTRCAIRLPQFETPKALANSSPGFERSENPGSQQRKRQTLKALGLCDFNPYRVESMVVDVFPGLSLCSNPGLQLANAFGVTYNETASRLNSERTLLVGKQSSILEVQGSREVESERQHRSSPQR
jgi:hypothetical protein